MNSVKFLILTTLIISQQITASPLNSIKDSCSRYLRHFNKAKNFYLLKENKKVHSFRELSEFLTQKEGQKHFSRYTFPLFKEHNLKNDLDTINSSDLLSIATEITKIFFSIEKKSEFLKFDYILSLLSLNLTSLERELFLNFLKENFSEEIDYQEISAFFITYFSNKNAVPHHDHFSRIGIGHQLLTSPSPIFHVAKLMNSFQFALALKRLHQTKQLSRYSMSELLDSPYAKRMKFTKKEVSSLYKELARIESYLDDKTLEKVIQEVFPIFRSKKQLFSSAISDFSIKKLPVSDQGCWGSCWSYALSTELSYLLSKKHNFEIRINHDYLYINYLILEAHRYIQDGGKFVQAGDIEDYGKVILKAGLLLDKHWRLKSTFKTAKVKDEILNRIESLRSDIVNNPAIKEDRSKLEQYMAMAEDIIYEYAGRPVTKVNHNEMEITPQDLSKKLLEVEINDIFENSISIPKTHQIDLYSHKKNLRDHLKKAKTWEQRLDLKFIMVLLKKILLNPHLEVGSTVRYWLLPNYATTSEKREFHKIFKRIQESIDNGHPVLLSHKTYKGVSFTNERGVQFYFKGAYTFSLPEGVNLRKSTSSHSIVIVGYELDKNGNVSGLELQNSWSSKSGLKGTFFTDLNFVKKAGIGLTFPKKI